MQRKPFTIFDLHLAARTGEVEISLLPLDYADAKAAFMAHGHDVVREPGRSGEHFLTAFCVVTPSETFH